MEITLGPITAIPPGEGRTFRVGAERIAVFRTRQGRVFASRAECPHRGGPLADGLVGGHFVICPLHAWKFDLETGQSAGTACSLQTYPVRLSAAGPIIVDFSAAPSLEARPA